MRDSMKNTWDKELGLESNKAFEKNILAMKIATKTNLKITDYESLKNSSSPSIYNKQGLFKNFAIKKNENKKLMERNKSNVLNSTKKYNIKIPLLSSTSDCMSGVADNLVSKQSRLSNLNSSDLSKIKFDKNFSQFITTSHTINIHNNDHNNYNINNNLWQSYKSEIYSNEKNKKIKIAKDFSDAKTNKNIILKKHSNKVYNKSSSMADINEHENDVFNIEKNEQVLNLKSSCNNKIISKNKTSSCGLINNSNSIIDNNTNFTTLTKINNNYINITSTKNNCHFNMFNDEEVSSKEADISTMNKDSNLGLDSNIENIKIPNEDVFNKKIREFSKSKNRTFSPAAVLENQKRLNSNESKKHSLLLNSNYEYLLFPKENKNLSDVKLLKPFFDYKLNVSESKIGRKITKYANNLITIDNKNNNNSVKTPKMEKNLKGQKTQEKEDLYIPQDVVHKIAFNQDKLKLNQKLITHKLIYESPIKRMKRPYLNYDDSIILNKNKNTQIIINQENNKHYFENEMKRHKESLTPSSPNPEYIRDENKVLETKKFNKTHHKESRKINQIIIDDKKDQVSNNVFAKSQSYFNKPNVNIHAYAASKEEVIKKRNKSMNITGKNLKVIGLSEETLERENRDNKITPDKEKIISKKLISLIKKRYQTADVIKKSVSSIANQQMIINNEILKPYFTKDSKNKGFKLFKKFFKSSDENVLRNIHDYIHQNLKLSSEERLAIQKFESQGSDNKTADSTITRWRNSKIDSIFKFSLKSPDNKPNQNQIIEKLNINKLEIIEENEKEEKKFDNPSKSYKKNEKEITLSGTEKQEKQAKRNASNLNSLREFSPTIECNKNKNFSSFFASEINVTKEVSLEDNPLLKIFDSKKENTLANRISIKANEGNNIRKFSVESFYPNLSNYTDTKKNNINIIKNEASENDLLAKKEKIEIQSNKNNKFINKKSIKSGISLLRNFSFVNNKKNYRFSIIKDMVEDSNLPSNRYVDNFNVHKKIQSVNTKNPMNNVNFNNTIKKKKQFYSNQKLPFKKLEFNNYDFIRNFNMSFEQDKKNQQDLTLSYFKCNNEEKANNSHLNFTPHINKSFDFNQSRLESPQFASIFSLNAKQKLNNSLYDIDAEESFDNSNISINIKDLKLNNIYLKKKPNAEKDIYDRMNLNEVITEKMKKKIEKTTPDGKHKSLKRFNLDSESQLKREIFGNMQKFILHKKDTDILKYDYMTNIDNGLVFKHELKVNKLNKLIPGNYLISEMPLKVESYQPKFIKSKFNKSFSNIVAGKPIVKNSDESTKEYCLYYEKKCLPKVVQDKDAFSVMTILK